MASIDYYILTEPPPATDYEALVAKAQRREGETAVEHLRRIRTMIGQDRPSQTDSTELIRMERERRTHDLMRALGW